MEDDPQASDRFDSVEDFYGKDAGENADPLAHALKKWDEHSYQPLKQRDIELYLLICNQIGFEPEILLGQGTVLLRHGPRRLELTWNGDDEDLLDLVLEGAALLDG